MMNIRKGSPLAYVVVLTRTSDGPVYLGTLDCGRQGVRRLEHAVRYKTRGGAERVAREYGRDAGVVIVPGEERGR